MAAAAPCTGSAPRSTSACSMRRARLGEPAACTKDATDGSSGLSSPMMRAGRARAGRQPRKEPAGGTCRTPIVPPVQVAAGDVWAMEQSRRATAAAPVAVGAVGEGWRPAAQLSVFKLFPCCSHAPHRRPAATLGVPLMHHAAERRLGTALCRNPAAVAKLFSLRQHLTASKGHRGGESAASLATPQAAAAGGRARCRATAVPCTHPNHAACCLQCCSCRAAQSGFPSPPSA